MVEPGNVVDSVYFFFNDTATTEISTLSLHDALPIFERVDSVRGHDDFNITTGVKPVKLVEDRKSTRLNSSHDDISYAVFCLHKSCALPIRSEEHTSELQARRQLGCRRVP